MKRMWMTAALAVSSTLHGAIFHEIDTTETLRCSFSKEQHNRIAIEDGRIRKVICSEGLFTFRMDSESGQVFITAIGPVTRPALVSVVTEEGVVQDLLVTLEDKDPEVVILRTPSDQPPEWQVSLDQRDGKITLLRSVLSSQVPEGYIPRELSNWHQRRIKGGQVAMEPTLLIDGPYDRIVAVKVRNSGEKVVQLDEQQFWQEGDCWIYIREQELRPREETVAVIASKR